VSRSGSGSSGGAGATGAADRFVTRVLRWGPGLLLALWLLAHASGFTVLRPVQQLDAWLHDARLRLFARATPDDRIAIVAIDERSLAELGRWPWSRARLADLLETIFTRDGAALVGLDVILAEPDRSSGLAALDELAAGPLRGNVGFAAALGARRAALDHDARLAATLRAHPVVLGFHLSSGAGAARSGALPAPLMAAAGLAPLPEYPGFGGNLDVFQQAAGWGGFLNADVDPDGVRRRAPLLALQSGQVHGTLALALARARLGGPPLRAQAGPAFGPDAPDALLLSGPQYTIRIAFGPQAQVVLPYAGRTGLTRTHSAVDVLAGRLAPDVLRGRIVLVGATAPGLADLHATPVAEHVPGVQAHASLLGAILDSRVPHVPAWAAPAESAALVALGAMLAVLWPLALPAATAVAAGTAAALVGANFAAWSALQLALPLAGPLVLVAGWFGWRLFFGHFVESRARRRLAELFGQYVPPELVARMSHDPARYDMRGRSAELTVLFADIRGFTALSETMAPDELAALINDFLSEMTDIVRAHGGTLDKYVGDEVMAFWGAPVPDPAHARHAVEAALAMQAALPALNARFAHRGWPALALGIGINSGSMVVGDLGSRHRRAYTVLGDAVNVGARLQQLSAHYDVGVVIGQSTRDAIADWPCRQLDTVAVRGRKAAVTLHEPLQPQFQRAAAPYPRGA